LDNVGLDIDFATIDDVLPFLDLGIRSFKAELLPPLFQSIIGKDFSQKRI
jgi:hypothetical protein